MEAFTGALRLRVLDILNFSTNNPTIQQKWDRNGRGEWGGTRKACSDLASARQSPGLAGPQESLRLLWILSKCAADYSDYSGCHRFTSSFACWPLLLTRSLWGLLMDSPPFILSNKIQKTLLTANTDWDGNQQQHQP